MNYFYIPTTSPEDWRRLLADPDRQWRTGFSARSIAYCWESAQGFPPEVMQLFLQSGVPAFQRVELLLAIPEHQVPMPPPGGHPSQNDLFALAKASDGQLIAITVEAKVSESFDKTLGEWNVEGSHGKVERLNFIKNQLDLTDEFPAQVRYQLLHRTASAVIEATRFNASSAVMIVHSFSQSDLWFHEYLTFLKLFGLQTASPGKLFFLTKTHGVNLYSGWARGDEKFLRA
jgi:hypothetical protein